MEVVTGFRKIKLQQARDEAKHAAVVALVDLGGCVIGQHPGGKCTTKQDNCRRLITGETAAFGADSSAPLKFWDKTAWGVRNKAREAVVIPRRSMIFT